MTMMVQCGLKVLQFVLIDKQQSDEQPPFARNGFTFIVKDEKTGLPAKSLPKETALRHLSSLAILSFNSINRAINSRRASAEGMKRV